MLGVVGVGMIHYFASNNDNVHECVACQKMVKTTKTGTYDIPGCRTGYLCCLATKRDALGCLGRPQSLRQCNRCLNNMLSAKCTKVCGTKYNSPKH